MTVERRSAAGLIEADTQIAPRRMDELAELRDAYLHVMRENARLRAEHASIVESTLWRAMHPVRRVANRIPSPIRRRVFQLLRLAWWTVTMQLGRRVRQKLSADRPGPGRFWSLGGGARRLLAASARPVVTSAASSQGRRAEDFDAAYYLQSNPDVALAGLNPLDHYLDHGRAEGRHPNAVAARENGLQLEELCEPRLDETWPKHGDEAFSVSVLTPAFNTDPRYLRELYQTLRNQIYSNWEWIIVDDCSSNPDQLVSLRSISAGDERVRVVMSATKLGISAATNLALTMARGTHAALVDHDDLLARNAFQSVYEAWKSAPTTHVFYTDECKLQPDGRPSEFWAKPAWSPAYLENTMCVGHLSIYRVDFIRSLGGLRSEFDGTQDFDLALRASLTGPTVTHVPTFSYLWRTSPGSTASSFAAKPYALERQRRAVLDYAQQRDADAEVRPGWSEGFWRIVYPLPSQPPLLSYVIPTGGGSRLVRGERVDLVLNCVKSFEDAAFYPNREYVVVHNGDLTPEQITALEHVPSLRLVHYAAPAFNFSEKLNLGVAAARGEYVCLLNDDVEAITSRGGEELISYLRTTPGVGMIAPLCLREDRTIQQNGVLLLTAGPAHVADRKPRNFPGPLGLLRCRREAFCVGGAIVFIRRDLYELVGGFDEKLPLNYNDVDFGLKVRERGLSCIVDPGIEVFHFESATRVGTSMVEQERMFLKHRGLSDPFFSRWYDQTRPDYVLKLKQQTSRLPFGSWLDRHIAERAATRVPAGLPKLSACVSVYDQPKFLLEEMYKSVWMQTYPNKEFVILDNGSSNSETLEWLAVAKKEGRATVVRSEENLGIAGGNRRLLETMTGEFFVAIDADDFLTADALQMLAYTIEQHPDKHVFYSDEFKSDVSSSRFAPFFKPDFDPILLMNCCYPAHLMAIRADFLRGNGGYGDDQATWSHDYDTLTRALAIGEDAVHVRELLYAWRINPGSTASAANLAKPGTVASQRFVLERLLAARGLAGAVSIEPNEIETSSGMWRLAAHRPVRNVEILSADAVWGDDGLGAEGLVAAARGAGVDWVAVLLDPDDRGALLELSALALFEPRLNAVSGVLLGADRTVRWSGGLFLPGGLVMEPYAGQDFRYGGYHGQLWCQRCVDVAAPVDVLIRATALLRVGSPAADLGSGELMSLLGVDAHERRELIAVTPQLQTTSSSAVAHPPLDRAGRLVGTPSLEAGSRWYDGRLDPERPYKMPGLA